MFVSKVPTAMEEARREVKTLKRGDFVILSNKTVVVVLENVKGDIVLSDLSRAIMARLDLTQGCVDISKIIRVEDGEWPTFAQVFLGAKDITSCQIV